MLMTGYLQGQQVSKSKQKSAFLGGQPKSQQKSAFLDEGQQNWPKPLVSHSLSSNIYQVFMQFAYKSKNISYFYLKTGTNIRENFFSIDNTMLDVYFFIYLGNFKIFRSAKGQHFLLEKVSKSQPFYGENSCRYPA